MEAPGEQSPGAPVQTGEGANAKSRQLTGPVSQSIILRNDEDLAREPTRRPALCQAIHCLIRVPMELEPDYYRILLVEDGTELASMMADSLASDGF